MKSVNVWILGLLMSVTFAQDTGGEMTGGAMTGGMTDASPTVLETITALEGGLSSLGTDQAVSNIEGWQARLEDAGDPALLTLAEQLGALSSALQAESIDQAEVGLLLTELGGRTSEAAETAQGDEAAQLASLGTLLSEAGNSLGNVNVEEVEVTGGGTGGMMTGGN